MQRKLALPLIAVFALGAICGEMHARYVARATNADTARRGTLRLVSRIGSAASVAEPATYANGSTTSDAAPAAINQPKTPESRFIAALSLPDGDARLASLKTSFIQWVSEDPSAALRAIERVPLAYRQELMVPGLAALAEREPDKALDSANAASESSPESLGAVLAVVARRDPQRALDLAETGSRA